MFSEENGEKNSPRKQKRIAKELKDILNLGR